MALQTADHISTYTDRRTLMPLAEDFPEFPVGWYLFCDSSQLRKGPFSKPFIGRGIVAYRGDSGRVYAMDSRCSHLGSDLGNGTIRGECIQCPFHAWMFQGDGRCSNIPAQKEIPEFARQRSYPAVERNGLVFIFNGDTASFDLPYFPGCEPDELYPSRPFGTVLDCPWYMAGANAFDLQHFRAAHDRRLQGEPEVDQPFPYAFRASGRFSVSGDTIQDRLTRMIAGEAVTLKIVDWCGSLSFATAEFGRTSTYGLVAREPLPRGRVKVDVIVFVRRSRSAWGRAIWDPIHVAIRRQFIKNFLTEDAIRLEGVRYTPERLIDADRDMASYFRWVATTAHGKPFRPTEKL